MYRLKDEAISRPKLCYYARSGNQLDKCKMAKYRAEGITLTDLVDREHEHTVSTHYALHYTQFQFH